MKKKESIKSKKKKRVLDRKKTDPSKFVFTGTESEKRIAVQLFKYHAAECIEDRDYNPATFEGFTDPNYRYWLNIYGLNDAETISALCKKQAIHDLVIQDILDVNQRPKFQAFENYNFLTLKSIMNDGQELISEQISIVFGSNYLMSFQERKADYFEHLRVRLRDKKGILSERGPDYLLYTLLESILDNYFKTLQQIEDAMEAFDVLEGMQDASPVVLEKIEWYKKQLHTIRKAIFPLKEFSLLIEREDNPFIEKKHLKYFLEIKDLSLTLLDQCDTLGSSLESSTNLFFSLQSHRMNQVMKTLTIVATIFIPLTFVAGIYGMNFSHMPELEWKYGYAGVWALFVIILMLMVFYFRKKKWF
ncbi:MAG: magnesium/cobalt transporter CorA [Salinivirgaceae bacterium]